MLMQKRIFECVRPLDWFVVIDLKDAWFHVSILLWQGIPAIHIRGSGMSVQAPAFRHLSQLGFLVNRGKNKLVPMQRISFLGMEFDSVSQTARLTQERAQSVLNCLKTLSGRTAVPLKLFQRLLGHVAATAAIVPLGCSIWDRLSTGWVPRLLTDVSATGLGATFNGHAVRGMDWSPTALAYQLPGVASSTPGPELPQKEAVPSRQGRSGSYGQHADLCVYQPAMRLRSRRMSQLARHLLLWSQKLLSAIHSPGVFNQAANELSRAALSGEWRLHPQAVQLIGVGSEWLR